MATASRVKFDESHKDDIGLVREIFLRRLREDGSRWSQFGTLDPEFERFLEFPSAKEKYRFDDLLRQVIWEFIVQGVIAPGNGFNYSGANIRFFTVTDFGHKVLSAGRVIPQDPDGYLAEIRAAGKTCADPVVAGYIEEALCCFARGCWTASVLLLGVAAEAVVLKACELIVAESADPALRKAYENLPESVKHRHRWLVDRYNVLPAKVRREALPDGLDVTLTSAYDLIRRQRNDLGHPQAIPPVIDRQHAFVFFQVFLTVVGDLEAFATYR
jgi:hypothetical protein